MTAQSTTFQPSSHLRAFMDQLYEVKFSKHVPLIVVLMSMIYTIYRTHHYLSTRFTLGPLVSWPTATFIELLVLGASAAMFIALRSAFVAQLKDEDTDLAQWGIWLGFVALGLAFVALLGLAGADAYALTNDYVPAGVMVLIQATQMLFICGFIINATIDEREKLRREYSGWQRATAQQAASECPYCHKEVAPNNRKRHMDACPMRP